ncbi:acyl-CoA/acyl-ACP dehydrogenase [Pseudomaricurvus alkylphenolicus]|uniref:acyl-CoA dehydrogenase family protein n=1 Tax=Pseudomaricurvus alkylphenolicus TaxID=1306991 RepID=UPI00142107EB|nr:acyl-CoA dehydrogenase family protein [Pseudomaricurvus alkylphenolicus]NIB42434.1 acyl-CoA/acyl-ACP dehydrogenase [Pseudomaricurvus alkylphenolicus]
MNFEFSDEQNMLREQARAYLAEHCSTEVVRKVLESDLSFDTKLWQGTVEMGWTSAATPEEYSGLGLSEMELCVIAEELGRSLAPIPFGSSIYLAAQAVLLAGSEAQKQQWLPRLSHGETIGTLALSEGAGSPSYDLLQAQVRNGKLTAKKTPVIDGMIADMAIVVARGDSGKPGLYLADLSAAGVERKLLSSIDESRPQAEIIFTDTAVELLGEGQALIEQLLDRAAILFAFEQLGGAQRALEMAVQYASERFAFGRQIGSFQAIKHKLADMFATLEMCKANCYYAAWALTTSSDDLPLAAATARVSASQAYYQCSKENIQVHGGSGFTWELDAHLYYRRAKVLSLVIGGERRWKERVVSQLETAEAGAPTAA